MRRRQNGVLLFVSDPQMGITFRNTIAFRTMRKIGTAMLTPVQFSLSTGHFRSAIASKALDARGKPLPWYTYPAIDFLSGVDFSGQSVLEFGAGQSTRWWAERAERVFSVEQDARWFKAVLKAIKSKANVELHLAQERVEFAATPIGRSFDVIVIDGGDRFLCAQSSLKMLQPGGVVVLDNSEGFWGAEGSYPIIDLFEREGFMRVDFYGFAPGVPNRHCTSLFFRDGARIFRYLRPPMRRA
jgi:hypothetical protein